MAYTEYTEIGDMHCHTAFLENAGELERRARQEGRPLLGMSCTPAEYQANTAAGIHPALGLHPWWVDSGAVGETALQDFEELHPKASCIGEVGLDFYKQRAQSREEQIEAFRRVCSCVREEPAGRLVSIHSLRAERETLNVLEEFGLASSCICVMHGYSGPCDELHRAIKMGCWFSLGPRSLRSAKSRQYAQLIPAERLLLETDEPSNPIAPAPYNPQHPRWPLAYEDWAASLEEVLACLEQLRGERLRETIIENQNAALT